MIINIILTYLVERKDKMSKRKAITIVAVLLILFGAAYIILFSGKSSATKVKVTEAKVGDIRAYLSTSGVVKSKQSKEYFGTQLKVNKVNVKVGEVVEKGKVIISYDVEDLRAAEKQAQIQYNNALLQQKEIINQRNQINNKISELDNKIEEAENSGNPADLAMLPALRQQREALQPISEEKVKQVNNSVSLAKTSLDLAKSRLSGVEGGVIADFDGTITALNVSEGSISNPAQPVAVLEDIENLKIIVSLGRYDAAKVKLGQEAIIREGGNTLKGKISFINPVAKGASPISAAGGDTTLSAEIDILDKATVLKVNFDVDVDILVSSASNALIIPAEAIISDKYDKTYVFINENGITQEKEVKIGIQSDTEAEVLQGLNKGDRVILNPGNVIKTGMKIEEAVEDKNARS